MTKLFFLALCGAAVFAQGSCYHLEALRKLTSGARGRVNDVWETISHAPFEFKNITQERVECLLWEEVLQETATNQTTLEATTKAMLKNLQLNKFQCIAQASMDTLNKLVVMGANIETGSEKIRDKGLGSVRRLDLLMPRFQEYIADFERQKSAEITKAGSNKEKEIVLEGARDKMNLLHTILKGIAAEVNNAKFKFLEDHINFAFQMENNLKKAHREGAQKIMKCVL